MKQCPKCNREHEREFSYCLQDGTELRDMFDPEATIVKPGFTSGNINIKNFRHWSRNEKLTLIGLFFAVLIGVATPLVAAWQNPHKAPVACSLFNDKPDEQFVYARRNCDKKSCDDDPSLIIGSYPNNTKVFKKEIPFVRGKNFDWVQVEAIDKGVVFWVAQSKLKCN